MVVRGVVHRGPGGGHRAVAASDSTDEGVPGGDSAAAGDGEIRMSNALKASNRATGQAQRIAETASCRFMSASFSTP